MSTLKVEELRIGNYLYDRKNQLCKVEALEAGPERQIYASAITSSITSLPNKPIPITDEILLKFGATLLPHLGEGYYKLGVYDLFLSNYSLEFFLPEYGCHSIRAESVHELQNIYYIVTGNELTFKE